MERCQRCISAHCDSRLGLTQTALDGEGSVPHTVYVLTRFICDLIYAACIATALAAVGLGMALFYGTLGIALGGKGLALAVGVGVVLTLVTEFAGIPANRNVTWFESNVTKARLARDAARYFRRFGR